MKNEGIAEINQPACRPFTVADAMILIVAVALGLSVARVGITLIIDGIRNAPRGQFLTLIGAVSLARFLNIVLMNFLFFLLPAFLILRLRRPRVVLKSLIHQPGFAACIAPFLLCIFLLLLSFLIPTDLPEPIAVGVQVLIAASPLIAWLLLIVTRRWQPEPGWLDRSGRVLGALWLISLSTHLIMIRLPY